MAEAPDRQISRPCRSIGRREDVVQTDPDQTQLTTWYTEHAVRFIEKNKDRPFFLYVAHNMPHVPLHVSDKFKGKSRQGLYGDVIEEIDWSVGQILAALKKQGLDDRTLVIFTSDNGPWLSYGNHAGSAGPLARREGHDLGRRPARAVHHALAGQNPGRRRLPGAAHDHRRRCRRWQNWPAPPCPPTASMVWTSGR